MPDWAKVKLSTVTGRETLECLIENLATSLNRFFRTADVAADKERPYEVSGFQSLNGWYFLLKSI